MRRIILALLCFNLSIDYVKAQTWSALESGIGASNYGAAYSSVIYNGELYVGGHFTSAGGITANNIAKWNGTNWSQVSDGINGEVHSLSVYNGELYAAGSFNAAGGMAAKDIAKWNGTTWANLGYLESYSINTLAVYNGELYAAGFFIFPNFPEGVAIAKWNGNNWTPVGPETPSYSVSIECMEVYNGDLYVAGSYYLLGGGGVAEFYRVLKWNGFNWSIVLTMPTTITLDGALGGILSMKTYNGELYVAGQFTGVDTIWASQIAKWNGNNWSAVGSGIAFESFPYGFDGSYYTLVRSLAVYNGALYATGFFNHCDTIITRNIAKWDGNNWTKLGLGLYGHGYTMTGTDTALFVGGIFNYVDGYNGIPANNIAAWKESCSSAPLQPALIHGNATVCSNTSQTYYVNEIPEAVSYTWTLPSGWTGYSTTNTITVLTGNHNGVISVVANNNCGISNVQTLHVSVTANSLPIIQGNITGSNSPCMGSTQLYSVSAIPNATDYTWTFPSGWIGSSTDTSITVIVGQSAGMIAVRANNNCGSSIPNVLPVVVATAPLKPDVIEGSQSVCTGTSNLYYALSAQPATNYSWLLPQGWSGSSSTDSITVIAGNTDGEISVSANNSCGSSAYQSLHVSADSIPAKPGTITGNIYTYTNYWTYYSIDKVTNAKDYKWSVGEGILQRGFPGNYTSAVWKKPGTYELSVKALNDCGLSEERKLMVKVIDFEQDDPFDINIYPNPSKGVFNLTAIMIHDKLIRVEVLTMSGQTVYSSGNRPGLNYFTQSIDIKKLPQGAYLVKVIVNDEVFTRKIIKTQ